MKALVSADEPVVYAYQDVFEEGDEWVKIQGCEACPIENRKRCCNQCPLFLEDNGLCMIHMGLCSIQKPYQCVVRPRPNICLSWCHLEFKCTKGKNEGAIIKIKEPALHISR